MIKERKPMDKKGLFFLMIGCSLIVAMMYMTYEDMRGLRELEARGQRVDKMLNEFREKYKADCELRGGVPIDTKHVPKCVKKDAFI
jgi:hypothetical protein